MSDYDIRGFTPPGNGCDLNHNEDRPAGVKITYYDCPFCQRSYPAGLFYGECRCGATYRGGKWQPCAIVKGDTCDIFGVIWLAFAVGTDKVLARNQFGTCQEFYKSAFRDFN